MRPPRRCLRCGQLHRNATYCDGCTRDRKRRRNAERGTATLVVGLHLATHGALCPGWEREPHRVEPGELTADHAGVAFSDGGTLADGAAVLCRSCNSRRRRQG